MAKPKSIRGSPQVWMEQAEHNAQTAHLLAAAGRWAESILKSFEAIEKALKSVGLERVTYGDLERFTHGELEAFTHGQLEGGTVPKTHRTKELIASPRHRRFPQKLLTNVHALKIDQERQRLGYPSGDVGEKVPYQLATEPRARRTLQVMDEVVERARLELSSP